MLEMVFLAGTSILLGTLVLFFQKVRAKIHKFNHIIKRYTLPDATLEKGTHEFIAKICHQILAWFLTPGIRWLLIILCSFI